MPRRLVPSGRTGGSSFLLDSLVISEFCCTFAPSTLETAVALKGDPSPGTTVSSALFESVLFGQDVGESARGAARWAVTPFLCHHT